MQRFELFASPVLVDHVEGIGGLARELTARLVSESEQQPSMRHSNVGGWHSLPDLGTRDERPFKALMELLVERLRRVVDGLASSRGVGINRTFRLAVQAWAMVMRPDDYTLPHDHAEAHLSGVFYLDAGDADLEVHPESGRLSFLDPRGAVSAPESLQLFPAIFNVRPRDHMLVVFPGFLRHFVHAYRGRRPRVCVSFNVRMQPVFEARSGSADVDAEADAGDLER